MTSPISQEAPDLSAQAGLQQHIHILGVLERSVQPGERTTFQYLGVHPAPPPITSIHQTGSPNRQTDRQTEGQVNPDR